MGRPGFQAGDPRRRRCGEAEFVPHSHPVGTTAGKFPAEAGSLMRSLSLIDNESEPRLRNSKLETRLLRYVNSGSVIYQMYNFGQVTYSLYNAPITLEMIRLPTSLGCFKIELIYVRHLEIYFTHSKCSVNLNLIYYVTTASLLTHKPFG